MKLRKPPTPPKRETYRHEHFVYIGDNLQELINDIPVGVQYKDVKFKIQYDYDSCHLKACYETIAEEKYDTYKKRWDKYEKKLAEYNQWVKDNQEAIEQHKKEQVAKKKKKLEAKQKQAAAELKKLERELKKYD